MTKKEEDIFITIDKGDESPVEGEKIANEIAHTKGILQQRTREMTCMKKRKGRIRKTRRIWKKKCRNKRFCR